MTVIDHRVAMTVECDGCGAKVTCSEYPRGRREVRACVEVRGFSDRRMQWTLPGQFCPACARHRARFEVRDTEFLSVPAVDAEVNHGD